MHEVLMVLNLAVGAIAVKNHGQHPREEKHRDKNIENYNPSMTMIIRGCALRFAGSTDAVVILAFEDVGPLLPCFAR